MIPSGTLLEDLYEFQKLFVICFSLIISILTGFENPSGDECRTNLNELFIVSFRILIFARAIERVR